MLRQTSEGVIISLHVQANANQSMIVGEHNGNLKIKIHAPPVDGKANAEIIRFFSQLLNISKSNIEILKGDSNKFKQVLIRNYDLENCKSLIPPKT